jgi:hypothetical protein
LHLPILGNNMPDMGTKKSTRVSEAAAAYATANLSDALFTSTQQRVLARLFGEEDRSFAMSELIQVTGSGSGAVQREVARLAGSGLLKVDTVGRQKRYRANPDSPIHAELRSIVRKTFGLADPLRRALLPFSDRIVAAFVFGSHAKRSDTGSSDIDLMVVADQVTYPELMATLHPVMAELGREISPTVLSTGEWRKRVKGGTAFVVRLLQQPQIWLMGSADDLAAG